MLRYITIRCYGRLIWIIEDREKEAHHAIPTSESGRISLSAVAATAKFLTSSSGFAALFCDPQ